jgi:hypothetical protein
VLCRIATLTQSPGFHARPTAGLDSNQMQASKGVKRKLDDHEGMFTLFQDFLTHTAHDYEDDPNEGNNCDKEDEEDELSDVASKLGLVRGRDVGFGFGVYHTMLLLLTTTTGSRKE